MAKPEKRWQLLLVADDGRIIPFKRIKGILLTLMVLLLLLGVICAGLAWQLTAEKVRHRRTGGKLEAANRQMAHYKSEHELIAAELVLAQVRMEKEGLLMPRRQERIPQQAPLTPIDAEANPDSTQNGGEKKAVPALPADPAVGAADVKQPSEATATTPMADAVQELTPDAQPAEVAPGPKKPLVAIGDLEIKYDGVGAVLTARFRVSNTGPRSSPVSGRCVVVLKNGGGDSKAWRTMPIVSLVAGKPDGKLGQPFKISRFRDMEITAPGPIDASSYKTARVYVFDNAGVPILEKDFTVDLPTLHPKPESVSSPVSPTNAAATGTRTVPVASPVNMPVATPADAGAAPHLVSGHVAFDDPSLTGNGKPPIKEDARAPF